MIYITLSQARGNDMFKILNIFGTRPEAIKMAPVIKEQGQCPANILPIVCVTAQHREMLDQVLRLFSILPDYDLNIMEHDQSLFDINISGLRAIEEVLLDARPDLVLVQGDTITTFIASLAAFYMRIPVGHIEAGLRTENKYQPFPEEINRRLVSHIADLHFAATEQAKRNLLREGVDIDNIFVTGNTVIDAMLSIVNNQDFSKKSIIGNRLKEQLRFLASSDRPRLIVVTAHRRENYGQGLEDICLALKEIASNNDDVEIVYPVHLSPNVQGPVLSILGGIRNIHLIEPLDYTSFIYLMNESYLILTDSGGIQEEAPSLGKPVLVMRKVTERPEAIEAGTTKLVGNSADQIVNETQRLLDDVNEYIRMSRVANPYGDGKAAEYIVRAISDRFL